jgi:NAD-dependent deacetylase
VASLPSVTRMDFGEGFRVEDVASPEGWHNDPAVVLDFYNQRRKRALEVSPNRGHEILASFEEFFDVIIITQNVDNLHERAGSTRVIHLHGSLFESRSTVDESLVYPIQGW